MTNGGIILPKLKAAALSTLVSWGCVVAALCALPLLGNFSGALRNASFPPAGWGVIGMLLIFLTWRFIPVSLAFVLSGNRRLAEMPVWILLAIYLPGAMLLAAWTQDKALWNSFCRLFPYLLAGLVTMKFLLAFAAFRLSLQRRLLSQSEVVGYLLVWCLLVAGLMLLLAVMVWLIPPPDRGTIRGWALVIVLLVPLARIGFCPIALSWNRHS